MRELLEELEEWLEREKRGLICPETAALIRAAIARIRELEDHCVSIDALRNERIRKLETEVAALLQSPPECPDCGAYPAQWSGKYWRPCEGCLAYYEHQEVGDE